MMKTVLLIIAKYALALALLGWVLSQVAFDELWHAASDIPLLYLVGALLFFNAAQWINAERMRYYYRQAGHRLGWWFTLKMGYVGMALNILVPGGIGGDAYRVYLLNKIGDISISQSIRLQFSNRISGLMAMIFWSFILLPILNISLSDSPFLIGIILFSWFGLTWIYLHLLLPVLREKGSTALSAFGYSLVAQSATILAIAIIASGLGIQHYIPEYLLLFLVAQVIGMLPITVGGLGLRELTFYYGTFFMSMLGVEGMQAELGVAISLCAFGITLISAMPGLFLWRKIHVENAIARHHTETTENT